tara:strand:- start:6185 stop:6901 length:717 start_codon:yes stop_codon:yes gene_type:complete
VPPLPPIERQTTPVELSPAARSAPTRLFFGGSFDPPHLGHVALPQRIAKHLDHAHIVYVPAARSPFKAAAPAPDQDRIELLTIALDGMDNASIWTQEIADAPLNPDQPSYWADTWASIAKLNLPGTNRFLIGADQARSMHRWRRYTEFWRDAIVMLRDDAASPATLIDQLRSLDAWTPSELDHWRSIIVPVPMIDCSSTSIRTALSNPDTRPHPIQGLDPRVQQAIIKRNLYLNRSSD